MNTHTHLMLMNELFNHPYGTSGEYDIIKLFKIYTSYEVKSFNDIYKEHKNFLYFVHDNIELFTGAPRDAQGKMSSEDERSIIHMARYLSLKLNSLHSKFYEAHRKDQEAFVDVVEKIIGNSKINLLEVGSGALPYSSILLAHDIGKMSSMDQFIISHESLESLDINPIDKYFDKDTEISAYDFIVGQKPCSAIGEIVRKCGKSKKPYFLQLCECDAPSHNLKSWEGYLKLFDPNIKFSQNTNYAYNLDAEYLK